MRGVRFPVVTSLFLIGACSNGSDSPAPTRANSAPTILAPAGVTGSTPLFEVSATALAPLTLTFAAADLDSDPIQWHATVISGSATGVGATFPNTATNTLTIELEAVNGAATAILAFLVSDGSVTITAFLAVERTVVPAAPSLASIAPDSAFRSAPQTVTLRGAGFSGAGANLVTFAGIAASDVIVLADDSISCATPTTTVTGPVEVGLANANGIAAPIAGALTLFQHPPQLQPTPTPVGPPLSAVVAKATAGGRIHLAYVTPGTTRTLIVSTSSDQGATWTDTTVLSPTNVNDVCIAAGDAAVCVASRTSTGLSVRRSIDGGATFSSTRFPRPGPGQLDPDGFIGLVNLRTSGAAFCLIGTYQELSTLRTIRPASMVSVDGGENWAGPVLMQSAGDPVNLALVGSRAYLVLRDDTSATFFNHSVDGGASWQPEDTRIADRPASMVVEGSRVGVAWASGLTLFFAECENGTSPFESRGLVLIDQDHRSVSFATSSPPAIALTADGAVVAGVWTDTHGGSGLAVAEYRRNGPGRIASLNTAVDPASLRLAASGSYLCFAGSQGSSGSGRFTFALSTGLSSHGERLWTIRRATGTTNDETGGLLQLDSARILLAWNDPTGAFLTRTIP